MRFWYELLGSTTGFRQVSVREPEETLGAGLGVVPARP